MIKPIIQTVAEYASTSENDKLNVMGVFDRIYADRFPFKVNQLVLVSRFLADAVEFNQKRQIRFQLVADDCSAELISANAEATIGGPEGESHTTFNIVVVARNLEFKQPGQYSFVVMVDDQKAGVVPLVVVSGKP